jgi:hypothetical protein
VANTQCSSERERQFGTLRLLTLATLPLPDVALYGELLHCHTAERRACCLVAQTLIGASSGAMRLADRALEMHALELGYRAEVWVGRVVDGAGDELSGSVADEKALPVALEQARLATLALTRATASTANRGRTDAAESPTDRRALLTHGRLCRLASADDRIGFSGRSAEAGPADRTFVSAPSGCAGADRRDDSDDVAVERDQRAVGPSGVRPRSFRSGRS